MADDSVRGIRSGFILAAVCVLVLSFSTITPVETFLTRPAHAVVVTKRAIWVLAGLSVVFGWLFLSRGPDTSSPWRKLIAAFSAALLSFSVLSYFLYTGVPVRHIVGSRFLTFVLELWMTARVWRDILVEISLIGAFFASGKARLSLAIAGTLMAILWGVAH